MEFQRGTLTWKIRYYYVIHLVCHTHFNFGKNIQDVQFGESYAEGKEHRDVNQP